jgi:8-oxo-dGTP pyrophosphatase MutT (NUDIX family)
MINLFRRKFAKLTPIFTMGERETIYRGKFLNYYH